MPLRVEYTFQPPPTRNAGDAVLQSACGHTVRAQYYGPRGPSGPGGLGHTGRSVFLYSHGNGEDLCTVQEFGGRVAAQGHAILLYDYCGFGNDNKPNERCCYANIDAAFRWLLANGWQPAQIVAWGWSLGSGPSCWLAGQQRLGGLLLQSAFFSVQALAQEQLRQPVRATDFPNCKAMRSVTCPVLIMHGTADAEIDWHHSQRLAQLAQGPVRCWFPARGHADLHEDTEFWTILQQWLVEKEQTSSEGVEI